MQKIIRERGGATADDVPFVYRSYRTYTYAYIVANSAGEESLDERSLNTQSLSYEYEALTLKASNAYTASCAFDTM